MIDQKHQVAMAGRIGVIGKTELTARAKAMLIAAVCAMADEFSDVTFSQIPDESADTKVLQFFCSCVRHHWARNEQGDAVTPCSLTDAAIHAPFTDAELLAVIILFERVHGPIWTPKPAKQLRRAS